MARKVTGKAERTLFDALEPPEEAGDHAKDTTSTLSDNLSLAVHRWFRYSAGFSGSWVASVLHVLNLGKQHLVLDPFAGAGTTPLECEFNGVKSVGLGGICAEGLFC